MEVSASCNCIISNLFLLHHLLDNITNCLLNLRERLQVVAVPCDGYQTQVRLYDAIEHTLLIVRMIA